MNTKNQRLPDQAVLAIRARAAKGCTARVLAQEYRLNVETIRRIVRRESYQLVGIAGELLADLGEEQ